MGDIVGQVADQALPPGIHLDGQQDSQDLGPDQVKPGIVTDGGEAAVATERQLELGTGVLYGGGGVIEHLAHVIVEEGRWLPVQPGEPPEQGVDLLVAQRVAGQRVGARSHPSRAVRAACTSSVSARPDQAPVSSTARPRMPPTEYGTRAHA